jgi:hypothetical protein
MIRKEKWVFDSNPSVTKDKQFVAYVTQGFSPEKSALKG